MLPYVGIDTSGQLAGDMLYAQDFGARNALLRRDVAIARGSRRGRRSSMESSTLFGS
jgi:hypothetical protein